MTKDINFCIGFVESYLMEMNASEETKEVCKTVTEILKKAEKYSWRDLRKNPDDLPKKDGNDESDYVLVLIGKPEWNHWEQAYYNHAKHMWSTYEQNVIGWKAIEPFEKEVE